MSYQIIDRSYDGKRGHVTRLDLEVEGSHVATVSKSGIGPVELTWLIYGPQTWPGAKEILLGLLDLSVHADNILRGASQ